MTPSPEKLHSSQSKPLKKASRQELRYFDRSHFVRQILGKFGTNVTEIQIAVFVSKASKIPSLSISAVPSYFTISIIKNFR
jgi:hypothetical protein